MLGKPTVRGARNTAETVEAVLAHLAASPDLNDVSIHEAARGSVDEDILAWLAWAVRDDRVLTG
jgi:hypothetical protein